MKTTTCKSNGQILRIAIALILIVGVSNFSLANSADPTKEKEKFKKDLIENLDLSFNQKTVLPGHQKINFKIYDAADNLLHEVLIRKDEVSKDEKLSKLLHKSDLVMEYGNTQFFKIN